MFKNARREGSRRKQLRKATAEVQDLSSPPPAANAPTAAPVPIPAPVPAPAHPPAPAPAPELGYPKTS